MNVIRMIAVAGLAITFACTGALAKPAQEEWVIQQHAPEFGPCTVYICRHALRLVNARFQFEIIATSPDYKMQAFRRKEKETCTIDNLNLQKVLIIADTEPTVNKSPYVQGKQRTYQGIVCNTFVEREGATTITTNSIKTDAHAISALCVYYNIPQLKEFPLANFWIPVKQKKYHTTAWMDMNQYNDVRTTGESYKFATDKIEKVPYNPKDFAIPPNLHVINDMRKVLMGAHQFGEFQSMIENLGFASDTGKDGKNTPNAKKAPSK